MQGSYCLQYKRLHAGETSAIWAIFWEMKAGSYCLEEAEDDLESHK